MSGDHSLLFLALDHKYQAPTATPTPLAAEPNRSAKLLQRGKVAVYHVAVHPSTGLLPLAGEHIKSG
eukprot:g6346.t1